MKLFNIIFFKAGICGFDWLKCVLSVNELFYQQVGLTLTEKLRTNIDNGKEVSE